MRATTDQTAVRGRFALSVGSAAVVFSALYSASDVLELLDGDFSTPQLVLT